jgi:hypothetical protein
MVTVRPGDDASMIADRAGAEFHRPITRILSQEGIIAILIRTLPSHQCAPFDEDPPSVDMLPDASAF